MHGWGWQWGEHGGRKQIVVGSNGGDNMYLYFLPYTFLSCHVQLYKQVSQRLGVDT